MSAPAGNAGSTRGHLMRVLGVGFGVAVIIGGTIGTGILRTPGMVADKLPNTWLFLGVWLLGALYALLGSFAASELSAMVPRSGGWYVFTRRGLGEYPGFVVGWTDWLSNCGTTAAVAMVVGEYLGNLFAIFTGHAVAIGCAIVIIVMTLQWRGVRTGSGVQNTMSTLQTLAFFAFVAAAVLLAHPVHPPVSHAVPMGVGLFAALVLAFQGVVYTFDGWYSVIYYGEEVKNPARAIPRSMFGGLAALTAIYLLVNVALLHVLGVGGIAGQNLALGTASTALFGPHGDTIIRALTIVSMLSASNAFQLNASRIPYAMACDGLAFRGLRHVNRGGTPTTALFFSSLAALALMITGSFERLAAILAFFFVADYTLAYVAVFVLRRREPDTPRPYRAWGYPWTTGIALLGSVAFLTAAIASDTRNSIYAVLVLAGSYPLYLAFRRLERA